eukprot:jgi/Orpsp1_1/1174588/evm.model.c7180000050668.3
MKYFINFLYYFIEIVLIFIHTSYAQYNNTLDNEISSGDQYYLIYVNNKYGELKLFSNPKHQKRQESQLFIESLIDEINNLIISNKDTYQNPEKLDEIEYASKLKKRSENQLSINFSNSDFVYPISSVNNRMVLYAFLSEKLIEEIKSIGTVIDCIPNGFAHLQHKYYNEEDILIESGWKGLNVREDSDLHLSLLSQGIYNISNANQYDNNYYYPASAGKDIDIVIIDSSFHFGFSEFSNTNERIVQCAVNIDMGLPDTSEIDTFCGFTDSCHGEAVSDVAAGLKHGAAPLANVYGVSIPAIGGIMEYADILAGIQYVYENLIRPHKTVINLSLAAYEEETTEFYKQFKSIVDSITKMGGIIVSSAGNNGEEIGKSKSQTIPCEYDNVICIGGINSDSNMKNDLNLEIIYVGNDYSKKLDYEKVYKIDSISNYGSPVDFYAPFHVTVEYLKYGKIYKTDFMGTSFSAPLTAGVIATIMSENPEIEFTKDIMHEYLYEKGKSEVVKKENDENFTGIMINNGKHIVYSKDNIYSGCGIYSGNLPCSSEHPVPSTSSEILPTTEPNKKDGVDDDVELKIKDEPNINEKPIIKNEPNPPTYNPGKRFKGDRCGPIYGKCVKPNECCSSYGYCGESSLYCGAGCQSSFGLCH